MSNIFDRMISQPDSNGTPGNETESSKRPDTPHSDQPSAQPTDESIDGESNSRGTETSDPSHGDRTPAEVRQVVQELLKQGYLEESDRRELFRKTLIYREAIISVLEPLDLNLQIDTHRGVAFLKVMHESPAEDQEDGGWSHPLVRRQRMTLEQSLLVAILRQSLVIHEQEAGVGQSPARVSVDELLPHFLTYFEDTGSDAKNESRLLQLLDQLKSYGIVSEVDKKMEVTIRPLIAHLANPESLTALLQVLRSQIADQTNQGTTKT